MATFDADVSRLVKSAGKDIDKLVADVKKDVHDRLWKLLEQVCALTPPANAERQVLAIIDKAGKLKEHAVAIGGELR